MNSRHEIRGGLKPLIKNYWGERVLTQIGYLEEVNLVDGGVFDELLDAATDKLDESYRDHDAITREDAIEIEKILSEASARVKSTVVYCAAHAHIDMNWMWRFDETVSITVDTVKTMLRLMDEYPDFTFSQSQASVYRIVELYAPELLPEIRRRINEKRWEVVASTWVETDKNMTNGESLTRHLLYTRRYLKKLLGLTDDMFTIDFEPDTFGHNLNVPEILSSGGVRYYYHCRGFDGHVMYRWRSPSGAEVKVFRDPTWYLESINNDSFMYVPAVCKKYNSNKMLHVYGVGDHGGGATRRDIERLIDYAAWPCMPDIRFGRYADFFEHMDSLELPVVEGELNFIFNGCYTSQSRIKKANRAAEAALMEAELFNAASGLCGSYGYDADAFADAWENVLFNHFHDILPGSGVIGTREYALGMFQRTMACAGVRKSSALRGICGMIDTSALLGSGEVPRDSRAEGAGVGFGVESFEFTSASLTGGKSRLFTIFNPCQTTKTSPSTITVWDWDGDRNMISVTDENKNPVEFELLDKEPVAYWGHEYFRALILCDIEPFGYRTVLLEERPRFLSHYALNANSDPRVDRDCPYVLENEFVRAEFDPRDAALVSFIDKENGTEYIDGTRGGRFRYIEEDGSEGMTAWRVGRYMNVWDVSEDVKASRVAGSLRRTFSFTAPVENSSLAVRVSLDKKSRTLRYDVECEWREIGLRGEAIPQLNFIVPLGYGCDSFIYDAAFGTVERAGRDYDVPGLSFAFARNGADGLMLTSDSKYGFRCHDDSLALSLIRSSFDPDGIPECYSHAFSFGIGVIKGGGTSVGRTLLETAADINRTAISVAAEPGAGSLPASGCLIRLKEGEAVISAVKAAEDSSAVIVRGYEVSGNDNDVTLEFFKEVSAAVRVDAHENELSEENAPVVSGREVKARYKAYGTTALKITFSG